MDLKKEDGRTAQTWTCSGGNPQQVSFCLAGGGRRASELIRMTRLGVRSTYVGIHHWTPSLPLNTAGTSLERPKIDEADGQTENRNANENQIGIGIGMDNQTKRSEREYGQSDKTIRKRIWTIR
jgi:hypothetical protein